MNQEDKVELYLQKLSGLVKSIDTDTEEGRFCEISTLLADLHNTLREDLQAQTHDTAASIILKLNRDEEISAEELALIRTWIVSDAEFYVQMENDFQNWISELNRIFSNIEQLGQQRPTPEMTGKISGSVRDALRVLADVIYFRQQEHRVKRFQQATSRLDSDDKRILAAYLRKKIHAEDM